MLYLEIMDIALRLPSDMGELVLKTYFNKYIDPMIKNHDICRWMNKCSSQRKSIVLECGAIQIGHTDYDSWVSVYLPNVRCCDICEYDRNMCIDCYTKYCLR